MPSPQYLGNTSWQRQSGAVSGASDGIVRYDVPYRGALGTPAAMFRQAWKKGASCPIPNYDHLKLVQGPEITEDGGGAGAAVLRFEGADITGDFGQPDGEDEEKWYAERRSVTINNPAYLDNLGATVYLFNAKIQTVTYIEDSRREEPKTTPNLKDPDWVGIERGPTFPLAVTDLVEGEDYDIEETTTLMSVSKRSDGAYIHTEWHDRAFVATPREGV